MFQGGDTTIETSIQKGMGVGRKTQKDLSNRTSGRIPDVGGRLSNEHTRGTIQERAGRDEETKSDPGDERDAATTTDRQNVEYIETVYTIYGRGVSCQWSTSRIWSVLYE